MNDSIIRVDRLVKTYGKTTAVDAVSFDIERGSLVGILGPNGAGKTTTLECLEGIIKPCSGSITINGRDAAQKSRTASRRIGIQLQSSALPGSLTVIEAMRLFCAYRKVRIRTDLLSRFGLDDKLGTQFAHLSTGQKRRLALTLSIIHSPEVLFLDEPTAGLDVDSRLKLHKIIDELKEEGTTVVLATHDMAEAENLSDRIIILLNGRIAAEGSPVEITSTGDSLSKILVKSEKNIISRASSPIPGTENARRDGEYQILFSNNIEESTSAILHMLKTAGDKLIDLRIERPSLEERFVEITKEQ